MQRLPSGTGTMGTMNLQTRYSYVASVGRGRTNTHFNLRQEQKYFGIHPTTTITTLIPKLHQIMPLAINGRIIMPHPQTPRRRNRKTMMPNPILRRRGKHSISRHQNLTSTASHVQGAVLQVRSSRSPLVHTVRWIRWRIL